MRCEHCGTILNDNDKFCNACGNKVEKKMQVDAISNNGAKDNSLKQKSSFTIKSRKGNKMVTVAIILIILAVIMGSVGGYLFFKNNDIGNIENDNDKVQEIPEVKNTAISFAGATFLIPDTMKYQLNENQLRLATDTWYAVIQENPYSYSTMSSLKNEYQEKLISQGNDVSFLEETKINENRYLLYKVNQDNQLLIMGLREYTTSSTLLLVIGNISNTLPTTAMLQEIDEVLSTSELKTIDKTFDGNEIDITEFITLIKDLEISQE